MKTTCTPKQTIVRLFADRTSSKEVGQLTLPDYEPMPKAIVFNDVIYTNDDRYSYSRDKYHAVELIHVAVDSEFTAAKPETTDEE
jgi:hypothetical protein